jgi:ABC-2 type transport system ATP-binding protein
MSLLEIRGLGKDYGTRVAVAALDLDVEKGAIVGLLGPNGAGKTTTISMISGVVTPSRGKASIAGHDTRTDAHAARAALGVVPQELAIYDPLTAVENLRFFGGLYRLGGALLAERIAWVLGVVGLADRKDEPAAKYSGGMKRRLNLACGLLHKPQLLVLDEPTVGVDPQSRNHIFETIRALRADGMTIVYTSHYMEEVEQLCDRVAIMDGGKVVAQGGVRELLDARAGGELELELAGAADAVAAARAAVAALPKDAPASALAAAAEGAGARVVALGARKPDLEQVFLELTGKTLRDA